MLIAGFEKLSLIDYPGNICSVIFTGGCNFRCPFCHNPELVVRTKQPLEEEKILYELKKRKKFIDGVCISGGEPTLHKNLKCLIKKIKALGLKVKLDTNGTNPPILKELLDEGLVDYVAMDVKTSPEKYETATGVNVNMKKIEQSIKIIIESGVEHEFRTTMIPGIVDMKDVAEITSSIKGAKKYALQQFNPVKTLDEKFQKVKPYDKEVIEEISQRITNIPVELRI